MHSEFPGLYAAASRPVLDSSCNPKRPVMTAHNPLPALFAAALCNAPALADTHVVDASGGGDFVDIATAVAASSDGDLILVAAGTYGGAVTIDGIDLVVTAASAGSVVVEGDLTVSDLPSGEGVTLSGMTLEGALTIRDSAGTVLVQDCTLPRPSFARISSVSDEWMFPTCGIGDADRSVLNSSAVSFTACSFEGAHGAAPGADGHPGWHALLVEHSNVALFDCSLEGGDGADGFVFHGPAFGGAGGDGLRVRGSGSHVTMARVNAVGGEGGEPQSWAPFGGCSGLSYRADPGNQVETAGHPDLVLRTPLLLVGGTPGVFEIEGPVGANVLLVLAERGHWRPLGPNVGTLLLGGAPRLVPLGSFPAGGRLTHEPFLPDPASTETHVELYYQAVAFLPTGRILSEPRVLAGVHSGL